MNVMISNKLQLLIIDLYIGSASFELFLYKTDAAYFMNFPNEEDIFRLNIREIKNPKNIICVGKCKKINN
jgi:hypothetical protein